MAGTGFGQRMLSLRNAERERERGTPRGPARNSRASSVLWIAADVFTILVAVVATTSFKVDIELSIWAKILWAGDLVYGQSIRLLVGLLFGFIFTLVLISRSMHLYEPLRLSSMLGEQRLNAQACFTSGLLTIGALYLVHAYYIPSSLLLFALLLITISLGARRLVYRILLYRRFEHGVGTRNVLIVGMGPDAQALRYHLDNLPYLGYEFKGFVNLPDELHKDNLQTDSAAAAVEKLFQTARKYFVDEILFTTSCSRDMIEEVLERAREDAVDLRVVPNLYYGKTLNAPVEFIGNFPTVRLYCSRAPELGFMIKRAFDLVFSVCVLIVMLPVFAVIAIAIKLDSPGPVFYLSERIGKKGRVFRCTKFRTMVADAEMRKTDILHMNERDDVLFKVANDPRITQLGRFLRKYSLDELPQFWNVLRGEMSVVGPRPPLGSEVMKYQLSHLRRLDVMPGITGLWQVQGRQDPSFASYVSLDVNYIDNWSIWLDFKIMVRTLHVVIAGTGT